MLDLVEQVVQAVAVPSTSGDGDGERLLTTREAAEMARRAPETIRGWVKAGRLRDVGGAGRPLYRRHDLQEAMSQPTRRRPGQRESPAQKAERIRGAR